jgi:hypothetical protein
MHGGTCFCGVWSQYCIIYRFEQIFCALHNWVPCFWRWWSFCPAYWCRVVSNLKLMVLYSNTKDNLLTLLPATTFCRDCHIMSQNSSSFWLKFVLFYWSSLENAHVVSCTGWMDQVGLVRHMATAALLKQKTSPSRMWRYFNLPPWFKPLITYSNVNPVEMTTACFPSIEIIFNPKLLCQSLPRSGSGLTVLFFYPVGICGDSHKLHHWPSYQQLV